ncbi:UNVERIFIED_CONTAM: Thaumatin-like protein [Sesamum radiatum]|uniref:Thaumatin-like protein n=1 Tax=Sesamum radiatum TaxID=300843 RepID=A0AAW2TUS5_SESRA
MLPLSTSRTDVATLSGPLLRLVAAEGSTRASPGRSTLHQALSRPGSGAGLIATSMAVVEANVRRVTATGSWNARVTVGPLTPWEFALNQPNNLDFVDISLVDGFNIPMEFSPTTDVCRNLRCTAPINEQCPNELRAPGGCNNPCTVFGTNEYCCTDGPGSCQPTDYSRFFKERCPDAYSYPQDDPTSLFTCPAGTNYRVVFCP